MDDSTGRDVVCEQTFWVASVMVDNRDNELLNRGRHVIWSGDVQTSLIPRF